MVITCGHVNVARYGPEVKLLSLTYAKSAVREYYKVYGLSLQTITVSAGSARVSIRVSVCAVRSARTYTCVHAYASACVRAHVCRNRDGSRSPTSRCFRRTKRARSVRVASTHHGPQ